MSTFWNIPNWLLLLGDKSNFLPSKVSETSENNGSGDWEWIYECWRWKLFQRHVSLFSPRLIPGGSTNYLDSWSNLGHKLQNNSLELFSFYTFHVSLVMGTIAYVMTIEKPSAKWPTFLGYIWQELKLLLTMYSLELIYF